MLHMLDDIMDVDGDHPMCEGGRDDYLYWKNKKERRWRYATSTALSL